MNWYKRNQLEDAICETLRASKVQARDLKLRIKRLLLTDRRLARGTRSDRRKSARYAFYSDQPQGSGNEVMFTAFEVFAVLAALLLLKHGVPQAKVVSILRGIRPDLEAAHREILKKDSEELFDEQAIRAIGDTGVIAVDSTAPIFLAFVELDIGRGRVHATIAVCRGLNELGKFLKQHTVVGSGATFFQFTRLMRTLAANLSQTRPAKRGRSTA
jgi:hypothetical protein